MKYEFHMPSERPQSNFCIFWMGRRGADPIAAYEYIDR
jgi:hypothetical protein